MVVKFDLGPSQVLPYRNPHSHYSLIMGVYRIILSKVWPILFSNSGTNIIRNSMLYVRVGNKFRFQQPSKGNG